MFVLGRVEVATGHFVQHVLRAQRLLADHSVQWMGLREPQWLTGRSPHSILPSNPSTECHEALLATIGRRRRPLSTTERAMIERGFIRAETILLIRAFSPALRSNVLFTMASPCLTIRFFRNLHNWELEKAITALDFSYCHSLSQLDPSLKCLSGLIGHQPDRVYERKAVYCVRQDRVVHDLNGVC